MSPDTLKTQAMVRLYHTPDFPPNQCGSCLTHTIQALLPLVWSLICQFANPQAYKQFIKSCHTVVGNDGTVRSVHEVTVIAGPPAHGSCEQLDLLDDELHVMVFSIIGGNHRLVNYQSTTTLHEVDRDSAGPNHSRTTVIESYMVDMPQDSNEEDTRLFAEMKIGCNLRSLAKVSEKMACAHKA